MATGPAMFDTARLDRAGVLKGTHSDPPAKRGRAPAKRRRPAARAGLRTASLDEVLCISGLDP
jgi:hypothetical protein